MEYAVVACRLLVGTVFLAAAWGKSRDVEDFADTVRVLTRVRPAAVRGLAWAVLAAEAGTAAAMAAPWRPVTAGGFAAALGLSAGFAVVLASALRRGVAEPCRCFGQRSGQRPVGATDLARDLVLAVAAGLGLAGDWRGTAHAGGIGALVVAGVSGVIAGIVLIVLDDIVGLYVADQETGKGNQWSSSVSR